MAIKDVLKEQVATTAALEWMLAATLARTFDSEAELRAWGEVASRTALIAAEARPEQPTADLYREAFDRVLALAVRLHGSSNRKYL